MKRWIFTDLSCIALKTLERFHKEDYEAMIAKQEAQDFAHQHERSQQHHSKLVIEACVTLVTEKGRPF